MVLQGRVSGKSRLTWNINDETGINKVKSRKESGQSVLNRGSSTYKKSETG